MDIAQVYQDLEADDPPAHLLKAGSAFALRTNLALLATFEGLPMFALSFEGTQLDERYPATHVPETAQPMFGVELPRYHAWRRMLLDLQLVATGRPVDIDPIAGLQRLARLEVGAWAANPFYTLRLALPSGVWPDELDHGLALKINADLSGHDWNMLRMAVSLMNRLRSSDLAAATGLLPADVIGPLPVRAARNRRVALPSRLEADYQRAPTTVRAAISLVYRLLSELEAIHDPDEVSVETLLTDDAEAIFRDYAPSDFGLTTPSRKVFKNYLRALRLYVRRLKQEPGEGAMDPAASAWGELRAALRKAGHGKEAQKLFSISGFAIKAGLAPQDLTLEWFAVTLANLPREQRNLFRSGSFTFDGLVNVEEVPEHLRPRQPSGFAKRSRKTNSQTVKPLPDPLQERWAMFFKALTHHGFRKYDLNSLSAVRSRAIERGIPPEAVDRAVLEGLLGDAAHGQRSRIHASARILDRARTYADLISFCSDAEIGALPDGRVTYQDLPHGLAAEVDKLSVEIGYGVSTRRAMRLAVKALYNASAEQGRVPAETLIDLLAEDTGLLSTCVDSHADAERYQRSLKALQDFTTLPWTPAWRELYGAARDCGYGPSVNPVPRLLRYAGGRSPQSLSAAWVDEVALNLRRPGEHSQYGRADLAATFLKHVERLEALQMRPDFRGKHLLPPDTLLLR